MDGRGSRRVVALAATLATFALAPALARAEIPSIPANAAGGGDIPCTTVASGENAGERHCSGIFTSFPEAPTPGAPIDVNVAFPPAPASGPDGSFPIVGVFHGWGGSKESLTGNGLQQWLDEGYAVFSMSDRGWGLSCGGTDLKRPTPACLNGYNHLMDTRYEVRDAQEVFEALADRDATGGPGGLIDPRGIAAVGGSYGGGISMALGALRDRKMMGGEVFTPPGVEGPDGTLVPWVSDEGTPMEIAAVQPDIPWTDLAYSLAPNGATLDYVADAPYRGPNGDRPIGVLKESFVAGLYATGQATSNYSATDPDANLPAWFARVNAGEPYDGDPVAEDMIDELTANHSSYYIEEDRDGPAPMLISNGWTDDLFPPDEAIRFYNRTRTNSPDAPISLIFTDTGHQRGQNKGPDAAFRNGERHRWLDYFVKGEGPRPYDGVQTLTQTCGGPSGGRDGPFDSPDDVPYAAASWAEIAPGEIRETSTEAQAIAPTGGDPAAGRAFDPIAGGGACATASGADEPGSASYRLPAAPTGGYTLMGSPTVIADFLSPGPTSQVAARLVDVGPDGTETLVARGLWRPEATGSAAAGTRQVFQLHPNGWSFAEGHVPKLELLPADQPYGRNSNGQAPVTVSNLELRLPVTQAPSDGGPVLEPAAKVVPPGYALAADFEQPPSASGDGGPGSASQPTPSAGDGPCAGAEARRGTAERDSMDGTDANDALFGRGGADRLAGGAGDDCVFGGRGGDTIAGGAGADTLNGGSQRDRIEGGGGVDRVRARRGRDSIDVRDGEADRVRCGRGRDVAIADAADRLRGCEIADT